MSARAPIGSRMPAGARPPAASPRVRTGRRIRRAPRSRLTWGVLVALLASLLAVSVVLARGALSREEDAATSRATTLAERALFPSLTPSLVSRPITGDAYTNLLTLVQGGMRGDGWVLRVRIWKPDGTLLFSTDRRDRIGQIFSVMRDRIRQVMEGDGGSFSRLTGETVAPKVGLDGSVEQLFETYVPLHLASRSEALGAVEVDSTYAAIHHEATRLWQPIQIASSIGLVFCLVSLLLSIRARTVGRAAGFEPMSPGGLVDRALEAERLKAEERVRRGEEAMRGVQARLSASEDKVNEVAAASRALEAKLRETERRVPELEAALLRSREELMRARQQPPADVARVQAELQKSYERLQLVESELKHAAERAQQAEDRLTESDAERARMGEQLEAARATGIEEGRLRDVEERLLQADERLVGKEVELQQVRRALAEKEAEAERFRERAVLSEETLIAGGSDVRRAAEQTQLATERAREMGERLAEAETRLRELEADRGLLADQVESLLAAPAASDEIKGLEGQLHLAEEQLRRASESLAGREAELRQAVEHVRQLEERLAQGEADRAALAQEAERARGLGDGATQAQAELHRVEEELQSMAARLEEMQARLEQGEAERQAFAAELFQTQEKLANREYELAQAVRRVRELEEGWPEPEVPEGSERDGRAAPDGSGQPPSEPEAEGEEGALEEAPPDGTPQADEAESLRSRLTRAAAMRHGGGAGTSPPGGSRPG